MFKNKDGSYNKVSIIILALIALIGIGIIASSIVLDIQTIDIDPLYIIFIGLIIAIGYICLRILNKRKVSSKNPIDNQVNDFTPLPTTPIQTPIETKPIEIVSESISTLKDEKYENLQSKLDTLHQSRRGTPSKPAGSFGVNIVGLVITLVTIVVVMMVGVSVVNSMMNSLPKLAVENSTWSTTQNEVLATTTNAFNIFGLLIPIVGLFIIIPIFTQLVRR